jgi:sulfhydrogenase subunit delta
MTRQRSLLTKMDKHKPKIGFFSLTCCEGCEIAILDLEDELLELVDKFEILNFRLAQQKAIDGPYDISFVEGSISTEEDLENIKHLREKSKVLVGLGTCAITGGVQAIKNFMGKEEAEEIVYGKKDFLKFKDVLSLSEAVKVDLVIRGCPIDKKEFLDIVKLLLLGEHAVQKEEAVCAECRLNEIDCIIENGGKCLGPITYCGCGAVCPHNGTWCIGCRGAMTDLNLDALISRLKKNGFKKSEIIRLIRFMNGNDERFKQIKIDD